MRFFPRTKSRIRQGPSVQCTYIFYLYIYFFLNDTPFYIYCLIRPSRPDDVFFGQPLTQTALPFCIAIEILCLRSIYLCICFNFLYELITIQWNYFCGTEIITATIISTKYKGFAINDQIFLDAMCPIFK